MVTRREFLQKSVLVTGGLAAGKLLVDPLAPVSLDAAQVDPNDPGLTSSEIKYGPRPMEPQSAAISPDPKGTWRVPP